MDFEAARARLEAFTGRARASKRSWDLAAAVRCAAVLADHHELDRGVGAALELAQGSASPFEQARKWLSYDERLRRANRRKDARAPLRAALDSVVACGATSWAERASAELRATGQAVPRRNPSASGRSTPQELQIALLVASGSSNRDVAGALVRERRCRSRRPGGDRATTSAQDGRGPPAIGGHDGRAVEDDADRSARADIHSRAELTDLFERRAEMNRPRPPQHVRTRLPRSDDRRRRVGRGAAAAVFDGDLGYGQLTDIDRDELRRAGAQPRPRTPLEEAP